MDYIKAFIVYYNELFTVGASDFFLKYLMSFSGLLFLVFCITIIKPRTVNLKNSSGTLKKHRSHTCV